MSKLILGLVGEMGCGKGTAVEHISEKYNASSYKYSNMLRDILDRLHLPQTRDNVAKTSQMIRETFGEDIMESTLICDMTNDPNEIIVLDGVRRKEDVQKLVTMPAFKLIFIDADIKTRYERIVKRAENPGDASKTFEKFQEEHRADADNRIKDLREYAHYIVTNNGQREEFFKQIDKIIKQ